MFRYWNVIVLFVLVQLLFGWLFSQPLVVEMNSQWSHSLLPAEAGEHGILAASLWDELLIAISGGMDLYFSPFFLGGMALLYILVSMFLLAGTLPLYSGLDLKFNWERFLSDGARLFQPFLGLAVISVLLFVAADFASDSVRTLIQDSLADSNDEASKFISGVLFTGLLRFLLFSLVILLFQYAKIISASEQLRSVFYLLKNALSFFSRHFLLVLALFALVGVLELLFILLDTAVWHFMIPEESIVIRLIWLIASSSTFVFLKLLYFATQTMAYKEIKRTEYEANSVQEVSRSESSYPRSGRLNELS